MSRLPSPPSALGRASLLLVLALVGCTGGGAATPTASPITTLPATQPTSPLPASPGATASQPTQAAPSPSAEASELPTPPGPGATGEPVGLEWRELAVAAGPSGREDHTWTVAGDGRNAYLFGGRSADGPSDELWRFDLQTDTWMSMVPAGERPSARFGHTAQWVEGVGLVIWSGQAGSRFFDDLWAFDPLADAWRQLPAQGDVPEARYGSCAGLGPDGRLWISHGFTADSGRFADTRAYDFTVQMWVDETPSTERPVKRCLHDCLWAPDGRLVLYGGQTTGVSAIGDLWAYQPDDGAWTEGPTPDLVPRQLYALAALGDSAYVFGGRGVNGEALGDLWQLDLAGLGWEELQTNESPPPLCAGATLVADQADDRLLLFGGVAGDGLLADLWVLELGAGGG
jgi:hypothetical protein